MAERENVHMGKVSRAVDGYESGVGYVQEHSHGKIDDLLVTQFRSYSANASLA